MFYRNRIAKESHISVKQTKFFYRSAIDHALRANQVGAIRKIINYILKFQEHYSSSFLLIKCLPAIFVLDIELRPILDSKVFNLEIKYKEWPSTHSNPDTVMMPYNGSIFRII